MLLFNIKHMEDKIMAEWVMDSNITIRLDSNRDDANREGAHCNVIKRGIGRVGRLVVTKSGSVYWSSTPDGNINRNTQNEIESFVRSKAWEIIEEYANIRNS